MKLIIFVAVFTALVATSLALKNEICGLPHSKDGENGLHCLAYMPSWTYDSEQNKCIKFIYGGCGGNLNRFMSQNLCERMCLE
ncbi:male accessory gland serine protease inhibitor-like [Drosophila kikkawai]|uniref:Male accessory gland serine protease inhibitor-like n=1 Tax=Drosophila kikkawai TaxID=30033 RepID=A0A6P4JV09_DROKI|nr:male accessory gland serine protease inhibitor-like [Drosophila kikkawai]